MALDALASSNSVSAPIRHTQQDFWDAVRTFNEKEEDEKTLLKIDFMTTICFISRDI